MEQNCLVVFLRYPGSGQVKTRLAAGIGDGNARRLYTCFVEDILDAVSSDAVALSIAYEPPEAARRVMEWLGPRHLYLPQEGADLGIRMQDAFRKLFAKGFEKIVLIGTDCPDMRMDPIREAFRGLDRAGSAVGPSLDGGYYLIGFRVNGYIPAAFEHIPWGTGAVFEKSISILKGAGHDPHILPARRDIDTAEDLADLVRTHSSGPFRESRTMRFLLARPDLLRKVKGE